MKRGLVIFAVTTALSCSAMEITSSSFSCFTDNLGLPAAVDENTSFGSDSWWGGGRVFTPWELSPDSKPEAMGEYMWTGAYPAWSGTEWGGDLFYTGTVDYGSFLAVRQGSIEPNTNPNATEVRASGQVDLVDKASGAPIGSDSFSLIFSRESQTTNYVPATRFTPEVESALYHVLDASLERRFFAGELTNQTWSVDTYGPREPKTAWFHLSDYPVDPTFDNPGRSCYYSPQKGISPSDDTNRVIFTRRFAEFGNIVTNLNALIKLSAGGYDALANRIHYPTVGRLPDGAWWSSSRLWEMWTDGSPSAVTTWSDALAWPQLTPHLMPRYSGMPSAAPLTSPGTDGYQVRFVYPVDHCFGNDNRVTARDAKLGITQNQEGELRTASGEPVTMEDLIASNFTASAFGALKNPPSRRFEPSLLAGMSQVLSLMDKTIATSDDAMDTDLNERRRYARSMGLHNRLVVNLADCTPVTGGWVLPATKEIDELSMSGWSEESSTNTVVTVSMTNAAPQKCSAWVHLSDTDESFTASVEGFAFSETITAADLNEPGRWMTRPPAGHEVPVVVALTQSGGGWRIELRNVGWETTPEFFGVIDYTVPSSINPVAFVTLARGFSADVSIHKPTDMEYQPGPFARAANVVSAATLWGFHSAAADGVFGRVYGIPDSVPVLSRFVSAAYSAPGAVEHDILTPWYSANLAEAAKLTGFEDPWSRIAFNAADASDRLKGAKLEVGTMFALAQGDAVTIITDVSASEISILRYIVGTQTVESETVSVPIEFTTTAIPVDGTNRFDTVSAVSADVKSTVTQIIDWQFNSLNPGDSSDQ